jgi:prepilin-type N-terminal cleavage/methylation domain-containing protein
MKRRNGFTLVELLAVIVVIALISLLAMPPLVNQLSKTKEYSKNAGF